jgi:hypothetical protein
MTTTNMLSERTVAVLSAAGMTALRAIVDAVQDADGRRVSQNRIGRTFQLSYFL